MGAKNPSCLTKLPPGLYENAMGESYPKREDYEYIKKKTQDVFYDPIIASKEVVDDVFETVNDQQTC